MPPDQKKSNAKNSDVSSCEITAYYRSQHPMISCDSLSGQLVTEEGAMAAQAFIENYDYRLAPRKIAVLAGYFLREAAGLLTTGKYDSCISFASGFSLLQYLLKCTGPVYSETAGSTLKDVKFIDSDLPEVMVLRKERLKEMQAKMDLDRDRLACIQSIGFDIEQAYKDGRQLKDVFPDCKRPLFILDGVSYFLSEGCVDWLMEQMASFEHSAVMMYYWPDTMAEESECFRGFQRAALGRDDFRESIVHFWDKETQQKFARLFPHHYQDLTLTEVEHALLPKEEERKLINPNTFFPVRVVFGKQTKLKTDGEAF